VVAPDGGLARAAFTGNLSVIDVAPVDGGRCFDLNFEQSMLVATRVRLQGGWELIVRAPQLPATLFGTGDTVDLSLAAGPGFTFGPSVNQTFTVSRDGGLLLFASAQHGNSLVRLPDLSASGISLGDGGIVCGFDAAGCLFRGHTLNVQLGNASAVVPRGTTQSIGPFAVSLEQYQDAVDTGFCDVSTDFHLAGVRVQP
jgi:hypothetical protein